VEYALLSKKAVRLPAQLSKKSLRELTRPGIKSWRVSAKAESEIHISNDNSDFSLPNTESRKVNTGIKRRKFATGSK
jgi:hypothetical protein